MNKIIVAMALVVTSSFALAQTGGNQDSNASDTGYKGAHNPVRAQRMQNELNLTDEQVKQMREIRDNGGTREEMQAVLTPEQRDKAAQLRTEHKGERDARRTRMQQELGLTDEQQAKLTQIRKDGGTREQMRAVLTPEQQAKFDDMRQQRMGAGDRPAKPGAAKPTDTTAAKPSADTPASGTE
jgi:Spy/CpxP family protein refolding chaperone